MHSMRVLSTCLVLLVLPATMAIAQKQEAPAEFRPLWNGSDLSGWDTLNSKEQDWVIKEGVLSIRNNTNSPPRLVTEAQYDDFELQMDYQLSKGGNLTLTIRAAEGTGAIES